MLRLSRSLLRPAGIVSVQVPLQMHPSDRLCTVAVLGSNQQQAPTPVSVALRSTRNLEALKVVIQATEDDVQPRELVDIAKHASQLFERSAKDSWQNVLLADITGGLCSLANKHLPQLSAKDTSSLLVLLAGLR